MSTSNSSRRFHVVPHTKTLEALLFLNQNRRLWNLATVAKVVNERDAELEEHEQASEEDEWE